MSLVAGQLDCVMLKATRTVETVLIVNIEMIHSARTGHGISLVFSGASNRSTGVFRRIFLRSSLLTCDSWSINSGIWSVLKVPDTHHFPVGVDSTMARRLLSFFRIMLAPSPFRHPIPACLQGACSRRTLGREADPTERTPEKLLRSHSEGRSICQVL